MIPRMHEFMQRQAIKDKIHQVTTEVFGFKIVSAKAIDEIESQMFEIFEYTAKAMSKKADDEKEMLMSAIMALLDITLTNLIIMYFQNEYIKSQNDDPEESN